MGDIVKCRAPYYYTREHQWQGGWAVRSGGAVVALVFDKNVAFELGTLLNKHDPKYVYGKVVEGEWK